MPKLTLPDALVRIIGLSAPSILVEGETVEASLRDACRRIPDLSAHLFHASGLFKDHFVLSVGGEVAWMNSRVRPAQEIEVLLAASGGRDDVDALSRDEIQRYSRHLTLPRVGRAGQLRLKRGRVLVIGAGGLGSPAAMYLAAAGVGHIGLIDHDVVEESNLQRQIVHGVATLGMPKVESARRRLAEINQFIEVIPFAESLNADNVLARLADFDVILDGSDNFATRYLVNDACVRLGKPLVYGAIHQFNGQLSVFNHDGGPCYRCLFPHAPPPELAPNCVGGGVIGVLPGVIGTLQAAEAIKLLLGLGNPLSGRLLRFNAMSMRFDELSFRRRSDCSACTSHGAIPLPDAGNHVCAAAGESVPEDWRISPIELLQRLTDAQRRICLLDVREPGELEICRLPGSIHIALDFLGRRLNELDPECEIVTICRSGPRADTATRLLRRSGFPHALTLAGGLVRWGRDVDATMATY